MTTNQMMQEINLYLVEVFPDCVFTYNSYLQRIFVRPPNPLWGFEIDSNLDFHMTAINLSRNNIYFMHNILKVAEEREDALIREKNHKLS